MSELTIYTYGIGEFTQQVLNAVAATTSSDEYQYAIKGAFLIAFVISVYKYILTKSIPEVAKAIFLFIGITTILLVPSRNVIIKDDVVGNTYHVSNVPIGLSYPAYLVSTTFYGLTRLVETSFHFVNDLNYSKSGFLFASHIVRNTSQMKITDPDLNKSLKSYINNCVFYDVYLGSYSFKDLLTSENTWELITQNASVNRSFDLNGNITVCKDGIGYFNDKWNGAIDNTILKYANLILPGNKSNNDDLKTKILTSVGSAYGYLTNNSQDATSILKQNILLNAINDSALDDPQSGMYSYAVARANAQKAIGNVTTGIMMARWLPAMQGTMECMMYAMFILVALYALFTGGEKVIKNYIITLVWLSSWPVVYAVMNFGLTWIIAMKSQGLGMSFYDNSALTQIQSDMSSLFGYFSLSVPFFAWGLINLAKQGLGSVFTQMAQLVGSSTQSLAMAASSEAVTGNYNMGNTSFDNHSMYNTSGFKHDTNMNYAAGATTSMLASGSTVTSTVDGASVVNMDSGISRLNTGINLSERISASATEQADNALSAARNDQLAYAENFASSSRSMYEIGSSINNNTSSGDSFRMSTSGGYAESASDYAAAIDRFAHDNNMSKQDAGRVLAGAYANLSGHISVDSDKQILGKIFSVGTGVSAGGKFSAGGKAEADRIWTNQDAENFAKAQEYITNNNLTQTFDKAYRGIEENSYGSNTSEGKSLIDNMNVSYDASNQASKNYSAHMQESASYRELASYTSENSASVNINANQDFLDYVASQPMRSGEGAMGAVQAESLLRTNPDLSRSYAEQFINDQTQSQISNWRSSNINSSNVTKASNSYSDSVSSRSGGIKNDHLENKSKLKQSNTGQTLSNMSVDNSAKSAVDSALSSASNGVNSTRSEINKSGSSVQSSVADRVKETSNE